jgi:hypothetical protein
LGRLPPSRGVAPTIWREIRVYKHYIVVGSEEPGHGIQIFDLKMLLNIDYKTGPVTFKPDKDLTAFWTVWLPAGRVHNVLTNEETGYAYLVGAQPRNSTCRSGLQFLNLQDPSNPKYEGW